MTKLLFSWLKILSPISDNNSKLWSFHLKDYNLVQDRVNALNPNVVIGQLPPFVLQVFGEAQSNVEIPLSSLEKKLMEVLMPFQKIGIRFGIEKRGRCLIADEMGLGKTYQVLAGRPALCMENDNKFLNFLKNQALALADFYKDDWPLLVCTTAATR